MKTGNPIWGIGVRVQVLLFMLFFNVNSEWVLNFPMSNYTRNGLKFLVSYFRAMYCRVVFTFGDSHNFLFCREGCYTPQFQCMVWLVMLLPQKKLTLILTPSVNRCLLCFLYRGCREWRRKTLPRHKFTTFMYLGISSLPGWQPWDIDQSLPGWQSWHVDQPVLLTEENIPRKQWNSFLWSFELSLLSGISWNREG